MPSKTASRAFLRSLPALAAVLWLNVILYSHPQISGFRQESQGPAVRAPHLLTRRSVMHTGKCPLLSGSSTDSREVYPAKKRPPPGAWCIPPQ